MFLVIKAKLRLFDISAEKADSPLPTQDYTSQLAYELKKPIASSYDSAMFLGSLEELLGKQGGQHAQLG